MDRKVERRGKAAGDRVLKGLSVCTLKSPRRLEIGVGVEMKSGNHCQNLPWVREWPWRRREDKLDCGQRSQKESRCAGGQRNGDWKAAVWGSVGWAAWDEGMRGWAASVSAAGRAAASVGDRFPVRQAEWGPLEMSWLITEQGSRKYREVFERRVWRLAQGKESSVINQNFRTQEVKLLERFLEDSSG